jgi:predicted DNA-binding ribbon-helix-helix protein
MKNKVATTVKVESALYDEFKVLGVRHKITLQALIERTVYRYVNEEAFRDDINNFILPVTTSTSVEPILVVSSSLS